MEVFAYWFLTQEQAEREGPLDIEPKSDTVEVKSKSDKIHQWQTWAGIQWPRHKLKNWKGGS